MDLRGLMNSFRINSDKVHLDNYINKDEKQVQRQILKVVRGKKRHVTLKRVTERLKNDFL